jgi:hypothetical protein
LKFYFTQQGKKNIINDTAQDAFDDAGENRQNEQDHGGVNKGYLDRIRGNRLAFSEAVAEAPYQQNFGDGTESKKRIIVDSVKKVGERDGGKYRSTDTGQKTRGKGYGAGKQGIQIQGQDEYITFNAG